MSFRGRNRGQQGKRGGGGGGGYGMNRRRDDDGPPEYIVEVGYFTHKCENDIVCHNTSGKIPHFNARIFFDNKEQIGSVDEIFGGLKDNGFTVKLANGLKASSFEQDQVLYIDPNKLLPIERFLPNGAARRGRGQTRGGGPGRGGRGGRGGGGRGGFRGRGGGGFDRGGGDRGGFHRGGDRGGRSWGGGDRDRNGQNWRGGDRGGRGGQNWRGGDRSSSSRGDRGGFSRGDRGGFNRGDRGETGENYKRKSWPAGDAPKSKKIRFDE